MTMKTLLKKITADHPRRMLYGTLTGIVAFSAAVPMFTSGMYEAALTDLAVAGILIALLMKNFASSAEKKPTFQERCAAWVLVASANFLALLPTQDFPGSLTVAFAFSLLIYAFVLFFSGRIMALACIVPTLWCCVFMPYHEEFMLLASYPLRLSATIFSAGLLKLCGIEVIFSGTSLSLPGLNIAITDACSGINQLDAFILIAFIAVQIMHKKNGWKILHFAFIIPAIIAGNSLRIVTTVLLYRVLGEKVLQNNWHVALGYGQIILALLIFLAVGKIFRMAENEKEENKP